jgi:hypothetical protein
MTKTRIAVFAVAIVITLVAGLAFEIVTTQLVRGAVQACSELFTVANRPDLTESARLDAGRRLCSKRYLRDHPLALAPEGGLVNIPRNLHKNFKAWREGPNVLICPTDRAPTRPIYQFVFEGDRWRFDGLIGILRASGEVVRTPELPDEAVELPDGLNKSRKDHGSLRR